MKYYTILLLAGSIFFLGSCDHNGKKSVVKSSDVLQIDTVPGNCPYLTTDRKGNIVMSWARVLNDSTSVFCYAISGDGGQSFGKPILIPASDNIQPHAENLPKIIFKPSGEIVALWGAANPNPKNKYSGMVFYSQSFDEGVTWNKPAMLVNDIAGIDQRYYDVALLANGEAAIIWLDNRKQTDKEGSSLYFAITEGKRGFQKEKVISEGCCQCCRTDLFVDSKSGIHVLYRGIIQDSIRDMVHSVSNDGGKSFSIPLRISNDNWVINGCPHTGPAMTENKSGLHFAWFTGGRNKGCYYTRSADNGNNFIQHDQVSPLGSHPQVAAFDNGKLGIAWDEAITVDSKFNKRIGVQVRSDAGVSERQGFITPDTVNASYPVLASAGGETCLIAYTVSKSGKDFIMYQRIKL